MPIMTIAGAVTIRALRLSKCSCTTGLCFVWQTRPHLRPYMRFLFVRPEFCPLGDLSTPKIRLSSDSAFGEVLPATGRLRDFHPRERALTRRTRNARNGSGLVPGVPTCLKSFMGLANIYIVGEDKGNPPASFIHTALFSRHRLAFQKAAPIVRINHADCLQICVNYRRPNEFHAPLLQVL